MDADEDEITVHGSPVAGSPADALLRGALSPPRNISMPGPVGNSSGGGSYGYERVDTSTGGR